MLTRIKPIYSVVVLSLFLSFSAYAEGLLWKAISDNKQEYYQLNHHDLQVQLGLVKRNTQLQAKKENILSLPLPNGTFTTVSLEKDLVVEEGLLAKYPQLVTWKLRGLDELTISGRIDFTDQGFHAVLSLKNGNTVYINPTTSGHYETVYKPEAAIKKPFTCSVKKTPEKPHKTQDLQQRSAMSSRTTKVINTYRIAIATTAEYSANFESKAASLQSVVTVLNRVNEIFQRDLSIRLILVENNDDIIFTDSETDPYNEAEDYQFVVNQSAIDEIIGSKNYDVGHLFTHRQGGLASIASVCNSSYKAQAMTGFTGEINDLFAIDYFSHELGHQFGATHTFSGVSGACQENNSTAYEPGSGSTIMSYAGLCSQDNLQVNSDAMFHGGSILQIKSFAFSGSGLSCANQIGTGNNEPVVNAGRDYIIPSQTPFILTGSAIYTDDNTVLSYSWEQFNNGAQPAALGDDKGDNAIIRSYLPISSPSRVIPKMSHLISNVNSASERLPFMARDEDNPLRFILTARDGQGGVDIDQMSTQVTTDGPFKVTSHQSAITEYVGSTISLTWDVAGTDQPPINCQSVDISVSTDQADSFRLLVAEAPNKGSAVLNLPNDLAASDQVRYKIQCHGNIFFALSPEDTQFAYHPYLEVSSPTLIEGNNGTKTLFFEVSLTKTIANDVHFNFQTQSITASSDDYVAIMGQATLKANTKSVLIGVKIKGDIEAEAHETIQLLVDTIESDTVLHYASAVGVGTIMDDDVEYHLTIDDASLLEGDSYGEMVFTVTLSAVMPTDIIIPYQVLAGSANGGDVVLHSGSTVIKAGTQTAKIVATVVGDTRPEDDEHFTVEISQPENATVVSVRDAVAIGSIYNDDLVTNPSLSLGDVVISQQNLQLDVMVNKAVANNVGYEVLVSPISINGLKAKTDSTLKGIIYIPAGMTRGVLELLNDGVSNKSIVNVQVKKRGANTAILDENKLVIENNVLAESPSTLVEKKESGGGGSLGGLILLFFTLYLLRSVGSGAHRKEKN